MPSGPEAACCQSSRLNIVYGQYGVDSYTPSVCLSIAPISGASSARCTGMRRRGGAPERIRTSDLQLRRLSLYPVRIRAREGCGVSEGTRTPNDRSHSPVLYH